MYGQSDLVDLVPDELFPWLSTRCKTSYQQLARRASDWALGSMIPRPPWTAGSVSVSHFTLACAGASLPPQMKFLMTLLIYAIIRRLGFQHAAKYHIEARRTWLATRILPAKDSKLWLRAMNLLFSANIILSKFASGGRWEPTRTPRYLVPSPSGNHLRLTLVPHCQVLSFLLAQMAADLCQFTFTPEVALKVVNTFYALSRFEEVPLR